MTQHNLRRMRVNNTNVVELDIIQSDVNSYFCIERHNYNSGSGWIYYLKGEGNLYKVGYSKQEPTKRIAEYSPKLPFETKLVSRYYIKDDVLGLEKWLHDVFDYMGWRVRGEWYELPEYFTKELFKSTEDGIQQ